MTRRIAGRVLFLAVLLGLSFTMASSWAGRRATALEQLNILVDIRHELVSAHVEAPDEEAMIEAAVRGMIDSIDDPYTHYFDPEEADAFDDQVAGRYSGIGAEINLRDQRLHIVTPLPDTPAWRVGVLPGDTVLEIDGHQTTDFGLAEGRRRLLGEPGTDVTILVRHESGQEQLITITRAVIEPENVRGFRRRADHHFDFMLDPTIGYIWITLFTERTADELRVALAEVVEADARALVLDLRFNPGGLLQSAVEVADMFLPSGYTVVSVEGRSTPKQVYRSTETTVMPEIPIVVLANEASASASEILTGALSENNRALFVGARTVGKGSVQQVKMLESSQGALKITNAYWYTPTGRIIHRRPDAEVWGVDPSDGSYVPMSPQQVKQMLDIRRAVDALRETDERDELAAVTPQWIEDDRKDPQLAAAVRALLGRLELGTWPQVGQSNAQELIKASRREGLVYRREGLRQVLAAVEEDLAKLDAGTVEPDLPSGAEAGVEPVSAPAKIKPEEPDEMGTTEDRGEPVRPEQP